MRCPRCEETLARYSLDEGEGSAVVCESCGFAGVPADHHSEGDSQESWDVALDRLEGAELLAKTQQIARAGGVSLPDRNDTGRTTIDADRVAETGVSATASITSDSEEAPEEAEPGETAESGEGTDSTKPGTSD